MERPCVLRLDKCGVGASPLAKSLSHITLSGLIETDSCQRGPPGVSALPPPSLLFWPSPTRSRDPTSRKRAIWHPDKEALTNGWRRTVVASTAALPLPVVVTCGPAWKQGDGHNDPSRSPPVPALPIFQRLINLLRPSQRLL